MTTPSQTEVGVLLTNLGSPDAPTPSALRRYLAEFLWDPRVVEFPRVAWWLILHGIILRLRPRRSARLYQSIWSEEGSPLIAITRRQAAGVEPRLRRRLGAEVPVVVAMRYGNPSIEAGLAALDARGVRRVLVLPLYPQYSASTTASTFDAVAEVLRRTRHIPELRFVGEYHRDAGYLDSLAASIRAHRERHGAAEQLLFSFHGIPQRYADAGDPYPGQCEATASAVARRLGLRDGEWRLTFQSRFGREPWLQPYTDHTLRELAAAGVRRVAVVCPGFAADCLETLEEIEGENRELFLEAGGEEFAYIAALNDAPDHLDALAAIAARNLAGWVEPETADER